MEVERLIPIRRPPVVVSTGAPWVPQGIDLDDVDHRWSQIMERNPRAFDGEVLHVVGVHRNGAGGVSIHVAPCAYRFYAVQTTGLDCGVRALGAKALTVVDGRILMGLRSDWVMYYPGQWEFVPGGSVQPGQEPLEPILEELQEEVFCNAPSPPIPIAVACDPHAYSWEVIHLIRLTPEEMPIGSSEYDALRWCELDALPEPLTPIAQQMKALAGSVDSV